MCVHSLSTCTIPDDDALPQGLVSLARANTMLGVIVVSATRRRCFMNGFLHIVWFSNVPELCHGRRSVALLWGRQRQPITTASARVAQIATIHPKLSHKPPRPFRQVSVSKSANPQIPPPSAKTHALKLHDLVYACSPPIKTNYCEVSFKNSIDPGHIAIFLRFVASSVFIRGYGVCHESTHGSYEEKVITCGMVAKLKNARVFNWFDLSF